MFAILNENLSRKFRLIYLAFALLIALAFDFFFWDVQVFGLGFCLFVSLYTLGFTLITFLSKQLHQPKALWLLLPIFIFSLDILLLNNEFVTGLVPLLVAILLLVYPFLLTLRNPEKMKFDFLRLKFLANFSKAFGKFRQMFNDLDFAHKDKNNDLYKKILVGVLVSVPILFVFLALFLSADPVFADKVHNLFDFNIEPTIVIRIFRTIFIASALAGFFYVLIDTIHEIKYRKEKSLKIDKTISAVVLTLINVLFASFVIIQLQYLFGSTSFVVNNNINFADYARQGFFQLAWVIVLASIILIIFYKSASDYGSHVLLKLLKIFLILQVAVIAMSALKRMNLYQDAYGFTTLRLYVEWFIYFCMAILTFTAVSLSIDFEFRKFFNVTVVLGIAALCVVSSINVDRMIASKNVDRFLNENKEIDMYYLSELSTDALSEIIKINTPFILDKVKNSDTSGGVNPFYDAKDTIINRWKEEYKNESWKEFNFSVDKLWKLKN